MAFVTRTGVLVALCFCATAVRTHAQVATSGGKWQVEMHAGGAIGDGSTSGTPIGAFPVGTPLSTVLGTFSSRAVSSWYFGDGAELLNQVNAVIRRQDRIAPLDSALTNASARRTGAAGLGFRVSRDLASRLSPEFSFEYARASVRFTDDALAAIEATRASFIPAWDALLSTGPTDGRNVTSTSEVARGSGHELSLTGALKVRLRTAGRLVPYATAGAGAALHRGTLPSATLTGSYGFRFIGQFPVNERDVVTLRVRNADSSFLALFGGGFDYAVSPRTGIRGDVRVHLRESRVDIVVNASPSVTMQTPAFVVATGSFPTIQFSNTTVFGRASSLSGPPVTDLRTFTGSGTDVVTNLTVGFFVRFCGRR